MRRVGEFGGHSRASAVARAHVAARRGDDAPAVSATAATPAAEVAEAAAAEAAVAELLGGVRARAAALHALGLARNRARGAWDARPSAVATRFLLCVCCSDPSAAR